MGANVDNEQTLSPFNDEEFDNSYVTWFGDTYFISAHNVEAYIDSKRNDIPVSGFTLATDKVTSVAIGTVVSKALEKGGATIASHLKDAILKGLLTTAIKGLGLFSTIDTVLGLFDIGPSAAAETYIRKAILNNFSYDQEQWYEYIFDKNPALKALADINEDHEDLSGIYLRNHLDNIEHCDHDQASNTYAEMTDILVREIREQNTEYEENYDEWLFIFKEAFDIYTLALDISWVIRGEYKEFCQREWNYEAIREAYVKYRNDFEKDVLSAYNEGKDSQYTTKNQSI